MRKYEIMVIIASNGTVDGQDVWGKRRMAYEINKKAEGTYAVLNVTAPADAVKEMDRLMSIDEQIMRAKVMRTDKK